MVFKRRLASFTRCAACREDREVNEELRRILQEKRDIEREKREVER